MRWLRELLERWGDMFDVAHDVFGDDRMTAEEFDHLLAAGEPVSLCVNLRRDSALDCLVAGCRWGDCRSPACECP